MPKLHLDGPEIDLLHAAPVIAIRDPVTPSTSLCVFALYHNICVSMGKSHRVLGTYRSQHRPVASDAFKLLPLVTLSGPGEGLPQVLCGPLLADDACGEPKMRIGVRVGAIRCFSAPQSRSASLPRRLRCHCSSVVRLAFPRPGARSRPFDPAAVRQNHRIVPTHA